MNLYFVALLLPPAPAAKILRYKEWMLANFGCSVALKSPAHITLIPPFRMSADLQPPFCKALDSFANEMVPFPIETSHFASFGKRTLFLEPVLSGALKQLHQSINRWAKEYPAFGATVDTRPFHPHITVANRDLSPQAFKAGQSYLAKQEATYSWPTDSIAVLRLKQNWEVIHTSQFTKTV